MTQQQKFASASDTLSALANMIFAFQGAPSMYEGGDKSASARLRRRLEKQRERQRHDRNDNSRIELATRRLEQADARQHATEAWRERQAEYRRQRDEKADADRAAWRRYQKGKDWITDFYRRNAVYMKTGQRLPANFDKLL